MLLAAIGGIGLFLLGMILLTDGLKAFAGDALRVLLTRAVSNPWSGAAWGAGITALVQSSSATSLVTIGLVSAGLLTFAQAVGVIVGANIGTTSTGWLVALVGVKFSVASFALPVIAVGAAMRLLGRGRWPSLGLALAGFGLLFVGLDAMAEGMSGLSEHINPGDLPLAGPLLGRALLVLIGAGLTVVMQSSSAAAATTLTALHSGAISLEQAAAMIVGQNIGTCATALLAVPGSPTPAKRTALAHVLFNLTSGAIVFAALTPFTDAVEWLAGRLGLESATTTVALFHTLFNVLGALLILPFAGLFAAGVERLLPQRGLALASALDGSVAGVAEVGAEAARRTVARIAAEEIHLAMEHPAPSEARAMEVERALATTRDFLTKLGSSSGFAHQQRRLVSLLHSLDHAERLLAAVRERGVPARAWALLDADAEAPALRRSLAGLASWLENPVGPSPRHEAEALSKAVESWRRRRRVEEIESAAASADGPMALDRLDAIRWLDRVAYHAWRLVTHLQAPGAEAADGGEETVVSEGAEEGLASGGEPPGPSAR